MSKRKLGSDNDRDEVKRLIKKETEAWKLQRLTAVRMGMNSSMDTKGIADALGVGEASIYRWFSTFRKGGFEALLQRAHKGSSSTYLDDEVRAFIQKGLQASRWNTVTQACQQLEDHFGRSYPYKTVWRWLKKAAGVLRIPRPVHEKRDPVRTEQWKRSFLGKLHALPLRKGRPVKVWFADESRYGLLPNLRRVWSIKGQRPYKSWQSKYQWSYCYGAIDAVDGDAVFIQTPSVNLDWTEAFLVELLKTYPNHEHIVVWDGAGFHPQNDDHPKIPAGLHTLRLPPYSPELNPIEKLWDLIQDHTANKLWPTIARMDQVVAEHLRPWWETPEKVYSLFGKGWIRASVNAS